MPRNKSHFVWYGGKSKIAPLVWQFFDPRVPAYVEPFAGSAAVLIHRPYYSDKFFELINDNDGFVVNYFRSIKFDAEKVAEFARKPRYHDELDAVRKYMHDYSFSLANQVRSDLKYYDAEIAGYWVWGLALHVQTEMTSKAHQKRPTLHRQGILAKGFDIDKEFELLACRLSSVDVHHGDWKKILSGYTLKKTKHEYGITAVFLDPPYRMLGRTRVYDQEDNDASDEARAWCKKNGDDPLLRIILCGYGDEHQELESLGWTTQKWKGEAFTSGNDNYMKETMWISPHCVRQEVSLFG